MYVCKIRKLCVSLIKREEGEILIVGVLDEG